MVSTRTKFALNQRTLDKIPIWRSEMRNQTFDKKNPFPLAGKTASNVRNWKSWRKLAET